MDSPSQNLCRWQKCHLRWKNPSPEKESSVCFTLSFVGGGLSTQQLRVCSQGSPAVRLVSHHQGRPRISPLSALLWTSFPLLLRVSWLCPTLCPTGVSLGWTCSGSEAPLSSHVLLNSFWQDKNYLIKAYLEKKKKWKPLSTCPGVFMLPEHFMPTRVWAPIAHLVFHSFFSVGCYCSD